MATQGRIVTDTPDISVIERIKEKIRQEWTDPTLLAAYRKWDVEESEWGSAAREVIIEHAQVKPGMKVLDLASGHGEPSLALAELVGPEGHVTATDLSDGLLALAEEKAERAGLTNMTFRTTDSHDLPFPDGTFDRVTCRLAVMYFADYPAALRESYRVLKPGGRATYLAWGPRDQPLFNICVDTIAKYVELPPSEPGEPSPFTFAEQGALSAALAEAGFRETEEEHLTIPSPFPGSVEQYWEWFVDMAPPFTRALNRLDPKQRTQAIDEVLEGLTRYNDGERVTIPIQIVVASGVR